MEKVPVGVHLIVWVDPTTQEMLVFVGWFKTRVPLILKGLEIALTLELLESWILTTTFVLIASAVGQSV